jgi:Ca-activated chloride channel homolog
MFRFAHSEYLYGLYLIPIIIGLIWYSYKNQNKLLEKFANVKLHKILFPLRSKFKTFTKSGLLILAMTFLIIALANPQIGSKIEEVKQVGIDVYILLDVSLSMKAEDIKPSRLDKAKHDISTLIQKLKGDRIGLIVFSGQAYIQFPLTTDYSAANLFLSAVTVNSVPQPGTAIGPALKLALNSFKKDEDTEKAIVIITDGEDHEGDIDSAVEEANNLGVKIYAIGLGSQGGAPIPLYNNNGAQIGYKKDNQGNVVLTKLDETILQDITSKANGKYYKGSNTDDELGMIYDDLANLEGSEFGATKITEYEDRYYYFLIPALILLVAEIFIKERKSKFFEKFEKKFESDTK